MGNELSIPKGRDTPSILQFILQEMFRRTDLADIYSLADPDRCKRYIVVATDALESLFLKLNLEPRKGPDGTLYVQSIEGLVKSIPPEQRARQREHCTELAFFFIRIFQIFGALFLSIYDSRLPSSTPGDEDQRRYRNREEVPFASPNSFLGLGQHGGYLSETRGPSFYIRDSPYDILNHHLMAPKAAESREPMKFDEKKYILTLNQFSIYDFPANGARQLKAEPKPRITYYYDYNGTTLQIEATLDVKKAEDNDSIYQVRLLNFEPKSSNWPPIKALREDLPGERLEEVDGPGSPPLSQGNRYPETKRKTLPSVLNAMFNKAIIAMIGEPPLSVVKFLKGYGYISQSTDRADKISGTHAYILTGQENQSTADIVLAAERIQVNKKGKTVNISIEAKLKIARKNIDDVRNKFAYRVEMNFDDSRVKPREYEYLLSGYRNKHEDFFSDSEKRAPTSEKSITVPQFIEMVFKDIIKRVDRDDEYDYGTKDFQRTREGLVKPYDSSRIPESMKIRKLWEAMAKDPPVKAHCMARAVQLLSVDAIKGDLSKPAFTSICKLKFAYNRDGSLPTPGRSVISSSGVYALSLLFFEGLENGAPRILDRDEYQEYRRSLTYLFEGYGDVNDVDTVEPIAEIKATVPKFCRELGDQRVTIPNTLARNLRGVTSELIRQQQSHIQRALSIIFDLFDLKSIERERKLKFSQRILSGGMPEIDRISDDTRRLLLEYYKKCELTYREGLVMVYDATRSRNDDPTMNNNDPRSLNN